MRLLQKFRDAIARLQQPKPKSNPVPKELPKPPQLRMDEHALQKYVAIASGEYSNIGLVPCYVNGEASSAIVAFLRQKNGDMHVIPLFVDLTHSMKLEDQFGDPMEETQPRKEAATEALELLNSIVKEHR